MAAITPNYLYVNACNRYLSDGAGQAASFRKLFPNYHVIFDNDTIEPQINVFQGAHLMTAPAHDNRDNDSNKVHAQFRNIFKKMADYASVNNLEVQLPLLGTGVFKNPVSCFKTEIGKQNFRYRMCFFNEEQKRIFDNIKPCKHGGYQEIGVVNIDTNKPSKYYHLLRDDNDIDRMTKKYQDLKVYIYAKYPHATFIHELSAAPGHFAKAESTDKKRRYKSSCYTGDHALDWKYGKPDYFYTDLNQHFNYVYKENVAYIYDNCLSDVDEEFIKSVLMRKAIFVGKYNPFNDTRMINIINSIYQVDNFINDHSNNTSGEIYFTINYEPKNLEVNKLSDIMQQRDMKNLEMKKTCVCEGLDDFIKNRVNRRLTFKSSKSGNITLGIIDAAPGNRKTTTIIKSTCKTCCLIVTPFKAVKAAVVAEEAMAHVISSAIEHLKSADIAYKYIFLDEIYNYSAENIITIKSMARSAQVIGLGDSDQCHHIDYDNVNNTIEIIDLKDKDMTTYRVPQAIVDLIKFPDGRKLITKNPLRS